VWFLCVFTFGLPSNSAIYYLKEKLLRSFYIPLAYELLGAGGRSPPNFFFLGRHIFAGFGPTYYRRADIFPGRHISGTT
jgi:hypothetical protein